MISLEANSHSTLSRVQRPLLFSSKHKIAFLILSSSEGASVFLPARDCVMIEAQISNIIWFSSQRSWSEELWKHVSSTTPTPIRPALAKSIRSYRHLSSSSELRHAAAHHDGHVLMVLKCSVHPVSARSQCRHPAPAIYAYGSQRQ